MEKIKSFLTLGIICACLVSCDQFNYAYLVNDTHNTIDVVISIIDTEEVQNSFAYHKLLHDSTASIYELPNKTTRIEFSLCSKCEFEIFFDTAPLNPRYLGADTLKIINQGEVVQFNTKEEIFDAFIEKVHYTKKYLTITKNNRRSL